MSVIFLVLPVGLLLSAGAVYACVKAIEAGQFDDTETPAIRAILDDEPAPAPPPSHP